MIAATLSPNGQLSVLDLDKVSTWRLELASVGTYLGIGIRYPAGTSFVITQDQNQIRGRGDPFPILLLVAINIEDAEIGKRIAHVGFPKQTLAENRERLTEALKSLHNSELSKLTPQRIDELIATASGLADVYHDLLTGILTSSRVTGKQGGYRYVLGSDRSALGCLAD